MPAPRKRGAAGAEQASPRRQSVARPPHGCRAGVASSPREWRGHGASCRSRGASRAQQAAKPRDALYFLYFLYFIDTPCRHSARTSSSFSAGKRRARSALNRSMSSRASAQIAAPRTTGASSSSSAATGSTSAASPLLPAAIGGVAHHPVAADPLDRRAGEHLRGSRRRRAPADRRARARRARRAAAKARLACAACGELVPRADRQAIVAAIDAVADRRAEFVRDRPGMLDRQIGDAAPRIEPIGRGKGVGRAGALAGVARCRSGRGPGASGARSSVV